MKVVFLDFIETLSSLEWDQTQKTFKMSAENIGSLSKDSLSPVCLSNFILLLRKFPDLHFVITSSWREGKDTREIKDYLSKSHKLLSERFLDTTPFLRSGNKSDEIRNWLSTTPKKIRSKVVIEMESAMNSVNNETFLVSEEIGLDLKTTEEIIDHFETFKGPARMGRNLPFY